MLGGEIIAGSSALVAQPLGVVQIAFKGYDLGKTTEESMLTPDQDVKDINYQQDGTKAADHVVTGKDFLLKVVLGEIKTELLALMDFGFESAGNAPASDGAGFGRQLYQSMRDNFAGPLKVAAVNGNGVPSESVTDIGFWYEAIPILDAHLINWGADTQRNLPINFRIKWHRFATGESATKVGGYGYYGDPTVIDYPAVVWPDVEAPILVSATATSATNIDVVFNKDVDFQTVFAAANFFADVDGVLHAPTAGAITDETLSLTFAAATFAAGGVIKLTISSIALEDTEATPNAYGGVDGEAVINSAP